MTVKKRLELSVLLAFIFTALLSAVRFEAACTEVKNDVFRLHIMANSNTSADQSLKLKVRDGILEYCENVFEGAKCKADAISYTKKYLPEILKAAKRIIEKNGSSYCVSGEIYNCYFPTREYERFTLPAGYYDALNIKIGSGRGHNWWCVLFPEVCLSAASDITDSLSDSTAGKITKSDEYNVEFKVVEWYNTARNKINSWFS